MNRIKAHILRHKTAYLVGSHVVIAGITWYIMRSTGVQRAPGISRVQRALTNTASLNFSNKPVINVITVSERVGRGHPGYPVLNLDTGRMFFSQKEAADAFGASKSVMSGHLQGKLPDVHGKRFMRVSLPT